MEPEILRRGKEFHQRVQSEWEGPAADGHIYPEHSILVGRVSAGAKRIRRGRLDLFIDEMGDFVSVIEIKSTDWDRVKPENRRKLMGSHRRQVWNYMEKYLDEDEANVCPGIIYPRSPETPGLKEEVEEYLNGWGLQVVWWYDDA